MRLELLLKGRDQLSAVIKRQSPLLRRLDKDAAKALKTLEKLFNLKPKSGFGNQFSSGIKKSSAEVEKIKKTFESTGKASASLRTRDARLQSFVIGTKKVAQAEEKLNAARRKFASNKTGAEAADKTKLAAATNKAAAAQEKLNAAKRREPKRGADGRRRDGRGRFLPDGSSSRPNRGGGVFEEDLLQGGTGAGLLWTAKQGLTSAMSKLEALSDLYNAFYRSSLGAGELNAQILKGEKIADELGNKLPGTTADYLQMFATMKQRSIGSEVVVGGAGKAAAYLSVANKEDRQETGANIARFGQMFNLKTESEYMSAADLMSRAKTTYGIGSDELMEAVKDFSGRTGKGLGIDGGKGAEDTLKYLAFLRAKTGMEGLTVGTAASSFFGQYLKAKQKKEDPTKERKKLTGVNLQIFDKKGKFLGLENAVKEFSKLKGKLTDEQSIEFGGKIAGEEGSAVFQAMVKNGDQFGAFNKEMSTTERVEAQIRERQELLKLLAGGLVVPICSELTNANPNSPHTVILEAFAWLLAQMAYRLNRVPEQNFIAFANLFGIEPRPATASETTLQFTVAAPPGTNVTIPVGTTVSDADGLYIFETIEAKTILSGTTTGNVRAARNLAGHTLLAPNVLTKMVDNVAFVTAVTNPAAIDSGSEIETLKSTLNRVKLYQRRGERIVSTADIEDAILNDALNGNGIVRAFPFVVNGAFDGEKKPGYTTVVVMTRNGEPIDTVAQGKIAALLDTVAGNQFVYVVNPAFVEFNVTANVRLNSGAPSLSTVAAIERSLRNFYAASREQFGRGIYCSEIIGLIESVAGVDRIEPTGALILASPIEDKKLREHELPKLVTVTINVV